MQTLCLHYPLMWRKLLLSSYGLYKSRYFEKNQGFKNSSKGDI